MGRTVENAICAYPAEVNQYMRIRKKGPGEDEEKMMMKIEKRTR